MKRENKDKCTILLKAKRAEVLRKQSAPHFTKERWSGRGIIFAGFKIADFTETKRKIEAILPSQPSLSE